MIVPDASVVLKWFLPEAGRDKALALLQHHVSAEDIMAVPELVYYEVSNILTVKSRLSVEAISEGMRYLYAFGLRSFLLDREQCLEAVRLARLYHLSIYDASYVALAALLRATLVTADERLARKVQGLTFVKTLEELEIR
ncbi:MAG TPA: type II toxin-antitoxin system VapC family toxin [Alphaproteobacteria bacterium]|nr:type II toxin-antitoxin system VapC family toxin [Alphaproteobacteria bacterium]